MAILKNKFSGNYVIVPKVFLMDEKLKLRERGLIATLLSFPDNWNFTAKGLGKITGEGKESINRSMRILIDKGYLIRRQERTKQGKYSENYIEICPDGKAANSLNKPMSANPSADKPLTKYQQQLNNKESNNNGINNSVQNKLQKRKPNTFKNFSERDVDYNEIGNALIMN